MHHDRPVISVIIPTKNVATSIGALVRAVQSHATDAFAVEVIVSDDGSSDRTVAAAQAAGARVVALGRSQGGNPAAARNRGAAAATGDPLVFLDADCEPGPGWLDALLAEHANGADIVGGPLDMPRGLSITARCDYYTGWYHVHSRRPAGPVISHPPGNIGVRRAVFAKTAGFDVTPSVAYAHEELRWQAEARHAGHNIIFTPPAVVYHRNRPGVGNMLRRNYRWGYSAIESKAQTRAARWSSVYRHPWLLILGSAPIAVLTALYIVACWLRARRYEPVLMLPLILGARVAYSTGMAVGGVRWILRRGDPAAAVRPLWE